MLQCLLSNRALSKQTENTFSGHDTNLSMGSKVRSMSGFSVCKLVAEISQIRPDHRSSMSFGDRPAVNGTVYVSCICIPVYIFVDNMDDLQACHFTDIWGPPWGSCLQVENH